MLFTSIRMFINRNDGYLTALRLAKYRGIAVFDSKYI